MCMAESMVMALPKVASDSNTEKGWPGNPDRFLLYFVFFFAFGFVIK